MRVFALTLVAVVMTTASAAVAADLPARPYAKAPAPVASWTGCYVGAGGGAAITTNDHNEYSTATGAPFNYNETTGARGWFGTIQAGCDYQFNGWVVGAFGDYDFMDVKGDMGIGGAFGGIARSVGSQRQDGQWALGGRAGYVVLPGLLAYVSGGYTQAHWKSTDMTVFGNVTPFVNLPGTTRGGWFVGAGDEYALDFLPGLFWKTEYRYSEFDRANLGVNFTPNFFAGGPTSTSTTEKFREHSVRSELVYRFNWGGTPAASTAELAAKPYTKAPAAPLVAANWTGCYLGAGGGGAYTTNDHSEYDSATGVTSSFNETAGARGWFGTVQAGCDYQFNKWVVGVFGDYDVMDVHGDIGFDGNNFIRAAGTQNQDSQWAAGGRIGYLIMPRLLTYFSGGYTQSHWQSTSMTQLAGGNSILPGTTRGGWFIGTGDEYALSVLPGLFWKTEYRYSEFDRANEPVNYGPGLGPQLAGGPTGTSATEKFREHSVRSELVYRFNWAGPVTAKY